MDRLATPGPLPDSANLDVEPFRGVRFASSAVGDLARVTSPPYDVVDAAGVRTLESADAHNVVRLILPREDDCGPEGRYRHAASTLRSWLADGTLTIDPAAGLYVYEQEEAGSVLQRGLIGAVGLRDPADLVILPHEDTMPGPVADRLELMRTGEANIEPIFLVYEGGQAAADVIDAVVRTPVLLAAATEDGITHRLWSVTDVNQLSRLRTDLAGRSAMIADGHHRYAAYRALQAERRAEIGAGPWDYGLALLVDLTTFPPVVGAIHRVISGLPLEQATKQAVAAGFVATVEPWPYDPLQTVEPGSWVIVDEALHAVTLQVDDPSRIDAYLPTNQSRTWRALDTAVLHHALLDGIWQIDDADVTYHHSAASALTHAEERAGLAILLAPVAINTVFELAAHGERMPRKSTSFGPKPRTGWVLRIFDA